MHKDIVIAPAKGGWWKVFYRYIPCVTADKKESLSNSGFRKAVREVDNSPLADMSRFRDVETK